jgi:hypothetical protein
MKTVKSILLATLAFGAVLVSTQITAYAAEKKSADKGGAKPYPLDICIVTDNDLGSMGDEKVIVYEGQTIKFCCAPCEAKFRKNPAKYLAKLTPAEPKK